MIYTFFYDNLQVYKCIQSTIKCCQRFNLWSFTLKNEIFVIVLELQTATNLAGPFLNFIEPGFVYEKTNFELALPEWKNRNKQPIIQTLHKSRTSNPQAGFDPALIWNYITVYFYHAITYIFWFPKKKFHNSLLFVIISSWNSK